MNIISPTNQLYLNVINDNAFFYSDNKCFKCSFDLEILDQKEIDFPYVLSEGQTNFPVFSHDFPQLFNTVQYKGAAYGIVFDRIFKFAEFAVSPVLFVPGVELDMTQNGRIQVAQQRLFISNGLKLFEVRDQAGNIILHQIPLYKQFYNLKLHSVSEQLLLRDPGGTFHILGFDDKAYSTTIKFEYTDILQDTNQFVAFYDQTIVKLVIFNGELKLNTYRNVKIDQVIQNFIVAKAGWELKYPLSYYPEESQSLSEIDSFSDFELIPSDFQYIQMNKIRFSSLIKSKFTINETINVLMKYNRLEDIGCLIDSTTLTEDELQNIHFSILHNYKLAAKLLNFIDRRGQESFALTFADHPEFWDCWGNKKFFIRPFVEDIANKSFNHFDFFLKANLANEQLFIIVKTAMEKRFVQYAMQMFDILNGRFQQIFQKSDNVQTIFSIISNNTTLEQFVQHFPGPDSTGFTMLMHFVICSPIIQIPEYLLVQAGALNCHRISALRYAVEAGNASKAVQLIDLEKDIPNQLDGGILMAIMRSPLHELIQKCSNQYQKWINDVPAAVYAQRYVDDSEIVQQIALATVTHVQARPVDICGDWYHKMTGLPLRMKTALADGLQEWEPGAQSYFGLRCQIGSKDCFGRSFVRILVFLQMETQRWDGVEPGMW